MNLTEIASIAGKGGLYKVVKPTRTGVIVESIDDKQVKFPASANHRISILEEISIYTTDAEGSAPLGEVLMNIKKEFDNDLGVSGTSDPEELKAFLKHVLPAYDEERVYVSDIKKLISWYNILNQHMPEIFTEEETKEEASEENKSEENK
jgi:hypothetical protein